MTFPSKHINKLRAGFTLIELLVTIGILAILMGGGIAGYNTFADRQTVLNEAKEVQQLFRTAQIKAQTRDQICGATKLQGYQVRRVDPNTFVLEAACHDNDNFSTPSSTPDVTTLDLATGLTATTTSDTTRFLTLERGTNLGGSGNTVTITRSGGDTAVFNISQGGAISNPELQ